MILDDLLNEIERAVAKHGPLPIGVDPSVRLVGACAAAERVARIATDQSPTWSALAVLVEEVDVEAVLEDFDIYQRLDAEGNHPPNRIRMEAILGRLGRQAPALAREVVALRDALATAEQERDELRLPLAADKATG